MKLLFILIPNPLHVKYFELYPQNGYSSEFCIKGHSSKKRLRGKVAFNIC
jgi:hypothetical protein